LFDMTTFDLRNARIRPGEEWRDEVELELEPIVLGGQRYLPIPEQVPAELRLTRASTGTVLELALTACLHGPCFRCLEDTVLELPIHACEYQATSPGESDELRSEYVHDSLVDLSSWGRDAVALELPDKILHDPNCAGLCAVCGRNLNTDPHEHDEDAVDARWSALERLREQL
jgi:uncharacterized protein